MDPVVKDPGSKESSKGCSASNQVVGNRYCNRCSGVAKRVICKRVGYGWGCSPNVWLSTCAATERGRGSPPTFALYIYSKPYKAIVLYAIQSYPQMYSSKYSRASERGGWRSTIVHSSAQSCPWCHSDYRIGVVPTAESRRTSVT